MGDEAKVAFWYVPWLQGRKLKDVAPTIIVISKRKNWSVKVALQDHAWVDKTDTSMSPQKFIGDL